ncbi:c-type cytochrome [Paenibacillus ginsengarvi]|uniref:Cytochrome c n=1 Tax=Paenibacillus ginsengarvi TaxID=400777 RepID=A0A3B0C7H6_9BACL|nr:cytochrome c [Paenibacillus ginsengarvi]RKN82013.1 cytochrome c [Paenibacillus ginsengarvi]
MQKWIMAVLFFGACAFGLIMLMVTAGGDKPAKEQEAQGPAMPSVTLDQAAAEALYKQSCIACHGNQLEGKIGPNLQKVGAKLTEAQLYKLVLNGKGGMPAFKSSLKEEEVANLALWLAQHK